MEETLWKGKLASGEPEEIRRKSSQNPNHILLEARSPSGIIADRWAIEESDGTYRLESQHTAFDMNSQQTKTVVDWPGQGIGSRLIALTLREISRQNGKEARIQGIENRRWAEHLIEKMGAKITRQAFPIDVQWSKEQLTLKNEQAWHAFLK